MPDANNQMHQHPTTELLCVHTLVCLAIRQIIVLGHRFAHCGHVTNHKSSVPDDISCAQPHCCCLCASGDQQQMIIYSVLPLNTVDLLSDNHNRHPIAHPKGWAMGCLLWVIWSMIYALLLRLVHCISYCIVTVHDDVIKWKHFPCY